MQNYIEYWKRCLTLIQDNISEAAYNTWFAPIVPLQYTNNVFVLQVPSQFFVEYIEEKYIDLLRAALYREVGVGTQLEYRIQIAGETISGPSAKVEQGLPKTYKEILSGTKQLPELDPQLNNVYTFNSFVEGKSNKLVRTAGISIANEPGKNIFNPLFVYGQSGVGKTHIANAIGIMTKQMHPEKRVLYVTANTFQLQYTDATRMNKINDFLNFYQTIDLLVVDDIHDFAGKTGTQNTFFHIFNYLHQSGKQLILTSDRSPMMLAGLEQRLLTRFKWGLAAEIEKPDFQLRKDILKNKIYRDGLEISEEIVDFIAENVSDNVRDLEGVLASLIAHSTLTDTPLNLDLTRQVVSRIVNITPKVLTIDKIRDSVCDYFSLSIETIATKSRKREVVQARQVAMYLSKKMTQNSLSAIGAGIGKRDHATVVHSCKIVEEQIEIDKHFRATVEEIENRIKSF